MSTGALHLVVPRGIDDPLRPSGGNTYDRRLCTALRDRGWRVHLVQVEGGWPWTAGRGSRPLERALLRLPDDALVLVDGLVASRLPQVMVPASRRLRVVLLVHLPVGVDDELARRPERGVVRAAASVLTPSAWCRDWLVATYDLDPGRVHVAHPGVDPAVSVPGSAEGSSLLTVGSVSGVKGQAGLLSALAEVADLPWRWTCVGPTTVDPAYAAMLWAMALHMGLADRIVLTGPLAGAELETAYAAADLLVLPSRAETYGMVVAEALSYGLPVVATDVGGVREALGESARGKLPGLLVAPYDCTALALALRRWLSDDLLRASLRAAARERRLQLVDWSVTAGIVADVVRQVAA